MQNLPEDIKLTFIIAILVMVLFVFFLIFVVMLYNKKQLYFIKEKQFTESEHQNELLQKELERQKSIQKERERISLDMHDDLGAGISALKLQTEFLKQKLKDPDLKDDVNDLLKTSEEMNLSMREMIWTLNSENDNLQKLVHYVSLYAENFFKKSKIKILIEKNEITDREISSEIRRNLFLCIKEALNNIYKHSNAEMIILRFSQSEGQFSIQIQDDGIGFDNDNKAGNGLKNMTERMINCKGNFNRLPSEKGVFIELLLPLKISS